MLIQIIPIEDPCLTDALTTLRSKNIYICSLSLITKLLTYPIPFKNRNTTIRNILDFLQRLDYYIKIKDSTLFTMHSSILRDQLGKAYNKYLDILKELDVMIRVPYPNNKFYEKGEIACQYRITNHHHFSELAIVVLEDINRPFIEEVKVHKKQRSTILNISVDYKSATLAEIAHCNDVEVLRIRLSLLFATNNYRYIKKGIKVDRITHSFSNVSRVSRKFLTVDGLPFHEVDMVNCQPMILALLLKNENLPIDKKYISDCESGTLYEKFVGLEGDFYEKDANDIQHLILTRDQVKVQLYKSVYFKFNPRNPVNRLFHKLYPKTWSSLKNLSKGETLASILQNLEASIFNPIVPKKSKYFFILFDAVYFTDISDKTQLIEDLSKPFTKVGLQVTVK